MTTAADPLFALAKRRETRSNGWLPYASYTGDRSVKSRSIAETEQDASALQAQIDRLRSHP